MVLQMTPEREDSTPEVRLNMFFSVMSNKTPRYAVMYWWTSVLGMGMRELCLIQNWTPKSEEDKETHVTSADRAKPNV